jgi:hypothetical protein
MTDLHTRERRPGGGGEGSRNEAPSEAASARDRLRHLRDGAHCLDHGKR